MAVVVPSGPSSLRIVVFLATGPSTHARRWIGRSRGRMSMAQSRGACEGRIRSSRASFAFSTSAWLTMTASRRVATPERPILGPVGEGNRRPDRMAVEQRRDVSAVHHVWRSGVEHSIGTNRRNERFVVFAEVTLQSEADVVRGSTPVTGQRRPRGLHWFGFSPLWTGHGFTWRHVFLSLVLPPVRRT